MPAKMQMKKSTKDTNDSHDRTVRVFLRIRPLVHQEIDNKRTQLCLETEPSDPTKLIFQRDGSTDSRAFNFHGVFEKDVSQQDVYDQFARDAVTAAVDGYFGVLFVYGQTGSGKTYTISNMEEGKQGMLQHALRDVWNRVQSDKDHDYNISITYIQLYNEQLSDLLQPNREDARVKMRFEGVGEDLTMVHERTGAEIKRQVGSYEDCLRYFHEGHERKETAMTNMNDKSSRSHCVFTLHIEVTPKADPSKGSDSDADAPPKPTALLGKLILCDLAGSERIAKTGAQGKALQEATSINSGLLVLGKVVNALTDKHNQHAPFRESKLTMLLRYALLGYGKTSLVVNVSPADWNGDETLSAIHFGQRAIQIKQKSERHQIVDYKQLFMQLQQQLEERNDDVLQSALNEQRLEFEQQVARLKEANDFLEQENTLLRSENDDLRARGVVSEEAAGGARTVPPVTPTTTAYADPNAAGGTPHSGGSTPPPQSLSSPMKPPSTRPPPAGGRRSEEDWLTFTKKVRESLHDRERQIESLIEHKRALGLLLHDEKSKVFMLERKLRAVAVHLNNELQESRMKVNELRGELAATRGTDYLSTNLPPPLSPSNASGQDDGLDDSSASPSTPSTSGANGNMSEMMGMSPQLEKARAVIQTLLNERIDMIVYQSNAQKAIHKLHKEKESLKQKLIVINGDQ